MAEQHSDQELDENPHLIFVVHDGLYCVDARSVREIILLPELAPVDGMPSFVAGVFDFRGKILPVIDLGDRLGHEPQPYCIDDCVVVLEIDQQIIGLIVNGVRDMRPISQAAIQATHGISRSTVPVVGEADIDGDIVMVLDLAAFSIEEGLVDEPSRGDHLHRIFCPDASEEERVIFHERAREMRQVPESGDVSGRYGLAVARLGGEHFGVVLDTVGEFAELTEITPIPCTPPHIKGYMNLRGDLVLLVDIREVLGMQATSQAQASKLIVVHDDKLLVGIPVDDVEDVIYITADQEGGIPVALRQATEESHLIGTLPYKNETLAILDLPGIMSGTELIVDEGP